MQWTKIAQEMKIRSARQCKDRWGNYLNPELERVEKWRMDEDQLLQEKVQNIGPKWAQIAKFFSGKTAMDCKNCYACLVRRSRINQRNNALINQQEQQPNKVEQNIDQLNNSTIQQEQQPNEVEQNIEQPLNEIELDIDWHDSMDDFNFDF